MPCGLSGPGSKRNQYEGNPTAQVHGPGAVQFLGLGVPEKSAAVIGDRNLSNEAVISPKEVET